MRMRASKTLWALARRCTVSGILLLAPIGGLRAQGNTNPCRDIASNLGAPELASGNLTGLTFGCVVKNIMGSSDGADAGGATNLIRALKPLARTIFIFAVLAEIAWLSVFGVADQGGTGVPHQIVKALFIALFYGVLVDNFTVVLGGFRDVAVNGSAAAQEQIVTAMNTPSADPMVIGTSVSAIETADRVLGKYLFLKDRNGVGATSRESARMNEFVRDEASCIAVALPAGAKVTDPLYARLVDVCKRIQERKPAATTVWEKATQAAKGISEGDFLTVFNHPYAALTAGLGQLVGIILTAVTATMAGLIGIGWVVLACMGPVLIALCPFRQTKGLGTWWFKGMFSLSILPILLSLGIAVWSGSVDSIIRTAGDNLFMSLAGQLMSAAAVVFVMVLGYSALQKLGGGVVETASMVGKAAVSAAAGVATGGASAGAAAFQGTAGSFGQKAAAAGRAALKGGVTEGGRQGTQMVGMMAGAMAGNTDARSLAASSTRQAVGTGIGFAGRKAAAGVSAAKAMASRRGTLEQPGVASGTTPMMQRREESLAGNQLAGALQKGTDYSQDANGGMNLTSDGAQKVSALRQAQRSSLKATAPLSDQAFVNSPGIKNRILGTHQSSLDPVLGKDTGSVDRTIAEHLPASIKAPRPGESTAQTGARVMGEVGRVRATAGGSWQSAERTIGKLSDVNARRAKGPDGKQYGIHDDDASLAVPDQDRRYNAMIGSAFDSYRAANPSRTPEASYQAVKTGAMTRNPQLPAETSDAYMQRVHDAVFIS